MTNSLRLSGGRRLQSPKGKNTRPTTGRVREAVMNILCDRLKDCHWLDLFSGSGVMSCEALRRGAKRVVAVELHPKTVQICRENLSLTKSSLNKAVTVQIINQDALKWLKQGCKSAGRGQFVGRFNLVYVDPPYNSNLYLPSLNALLLGNWLSKDSLVVCEYSAYKTLEIPQEWIEYDRRSYGQSSLLLISPREVHCDDTGSMQQQTNQAK